MLTIRRGWDTVSLRLLVPYMDRRLLSTTMDTSTRWKGHLLKPLKINKHGIDILHDPILNHGMAFDYPDRDRLNIRGLVPPRLLAFETQISRTLMNLRKQPDDMSKNIYLSELQDRNETLYYRVLLDNLEELAPVIYTPTVGRVCQAVMYLNAGGTTYRGMNILRSLLWAFQEFGQNYRRPRGMYFSSLDRGQFAQMIYNWPRNEVEVIVVTDGSRILGLGDLGCYGMGIPIGKLALYCAAGGISPHKVLPILIDVGTDNKALLEDPFYTGVKEPRLRGKEYFDVMDEFMDAVRGRFPTACIQFEDFSSNVALHILDKYRYEGLCFNDDIQGTGATTLGGILSALKNQGSSLQSALTQTRFLVAGAGSAGIGVAGMLLEGMKAYGMKAEDARKQFWVCDKDGLLTTARKDSLSPQQLGFARDDISEPLTLLECAKRFKPTALLGLSACRGLFNEPLLREMAQHNERPIIFPLSNPTSVAECTAEEAYTFTDGRCVFGSGSPFNPCTLNGKTYYPSQCNNLFIFPGVGLGAVVSGARIVTNGMLSASSEALATSLTEEERAEGRVFPSIRRVREVSVRVASAVAKAAIEEGVATKLHHGDTPCLDTIIRARMFDPVYVPLVEDVFRHRG